jgi:hypothetical protein
MNWTGGARARTNKKSNGIAAKQKQYFAKVRAKMMSNAFMGSSTEHGEGDDEAVPAIVRKRQKELLEFEIVVGAEKEKQKKRQLEEEGEVECTVGKKRLLHPSEDVPELGKRKIADEKKKEKIKSARNALLQTNDWVRTEMAAPPPLARPLGADRPRKEPRPFKRRNITELASPFLERFPRARPTPSIRTRGSQAITEDPSEYRARSDTGFNLFKPLENGGYVRIGKGRPAPNAVAESRRPWEARASKKKDSSPDSILLDAEESRRVSDSPFAAIEEEEEEEEETPTAAPEERPKARGQIVTRYSSDEIESDPFEPLVSPKPGTQQELTLETEDGEDNSESRFTAPVEQPPLEVEQQLFDAITTDEEDDATGIENDDVFLRTNPPPSSPSLTSRFQLQPERETEDLDELLRQIDEVAADTSFPSFPTPIKKRRPRSKSQSSPTSYVARFVSRGIPIESFDEVQEMAEEMEEEERQEERHEIQEPDAEMVTETTGEQEDEESTDPRNADASVSAKISSSPNVTSSADVEQNEPNIGPQNAPEVHDPWADFFSFPSEEESSTEEDEMASSVVGQRGTTIGGGEPLEGPTLEESAEVLIISNDTDESESSESSEEDEDEDEDEDEEEEEEEDEEAINQAKPVQASAKETPTSQSGAKWEEFMTRDPEPDIKTSGEISAGTNKSEPSAIKVSLTAAEELAWRRFVFGGADPESSDEDEYFHTAPKPKVPDGKRYTATPGLSPRATEVSSYFPSPARASKGSSTPVLSPITSRTVIDSASGGASVDSVVGNASSSVLSPARGIRNIRPSHLSPVRRGDAHSSLVGSGEYQALRRRPGTFMRPRRFVGGPVAPEANEEVEEIEDW